MVLTAIVLMLVLLVCWLLFSNLELNIDTRIPGLVLHWRTIAKLVLVFEYGDWWLKIYSLPYKNKWRLYELINRKKKKKIKVEGDRSKISKRSPIRFKKIIELLSSSQVNEWRLALDTDDFPFNACLFPLNFLPSCRQRLEINFKGENFLVLRITNSVWRLLNVWFK
jgi:hypothetical protein